MRSELEMELGEDLVKLQRNSQVVNLGDNQSELKLEYCGNRHRKIYPAVMANFVSVEQGGFTREWKD